MSRILMTWELGGNLGHITPLRILACALRERGHTVVFALRDIRGGAQILHQRRFAFLQAPVPSAHAAGITGDPASYPEILLQEGFADPKGLAALVQAWRNLYRLVAPDAIVFDHSPVALLAARGTGGLRILFGTGFVSPPRVSPMPSFRPWQRISMQRLETSEERVLASANMALSAIDATPIEALYQVFDVDEDILATLPELDHYRGRRGARYWGPVYDSGEGEEIRWPVVEGKKLFVYIRPESSAFRPLAATLRQAKLRTLWFAPGLSSQAVRKLQTGSLHFHLEPLDVAQVAVSADAAILHAGHGTTAAMLLGGTPMLLIPENLEQFLLARNLVAIGAAALVPPKALYTRLGAIVSSFLGNALHRTRAQAFASRYKDFDQGKQLARMVAGIEKLLQARSARMTNRPADRVGERQSA